MTHVIRPTIPEGIFVSFWCISFGISSPRSLSFGSGKGKKISALKSGGDSPNPPDFGSWDTPVEFYSHFYFSLMSIWPRYPI